MAAEILLNRDAMQTILKKKTYFKIIQKLMPLRIGKLSNKIYHFVLW